MVQMGATAITGKTVLVTGGNRGIGLEFVRQLIAKKNTVIATARNPVDAIELKALQPAAVLQLDVSDVASIQQFAADVKGSASHIDLLINNAGVYGPRSTFKTVTADDMLHCFKTNTIGPLLVVQQLHLQCLLGGAAPSTVANVTSKVGSVDDNQSGGGYAYRASKAALNIVNKSLSIDLSGEGVTCVLLHPGWVKTDMTGMTGLIDTHTCVAGLLGVLESDKPLQGHWYDYAGKEIPW